MYIVIIIIVI